MINNNNKIADFIQNSKKNCKDRSRGTINVINLEIKIVAIVAWIIFFN